MTPDRLDAYLHAHIPLTRHMQIRVLRAEPGELCLALPLAPNVNPHGTVFGGALSALGLVGGWLLLQFAFEQAGLKAHLVGKQGTCDFLAPATGDCVAQARVPAAERDALLAQFRRLGRVRVQVTTVIRVGERDVARHLGVYTALTPTSPRTSAP